MRDGLAIGVDLGATKIATALVDREGKVVKARQVLTLAKEGVGAVCDRIAAEVAPLLELGRGRVLGIGIGSPGIVESDKGIVRGPVNLGWGEVRLAAEIGRRFGGGVPVFVENDANINAVGEGMFGSARGCNDYVLLTVGSGLGAGFVSHGRLITGAHWIATDLGHYSVDPEGGRACACGHRGCAETVVSGPGLVSVMKEVRVGWEGSAEGVLELARGGDDDAVRALGMLAKVLGEVAGVAAAVVDPEVVVIGGGLGVAAFEMIKDGVEREMRRRVTRVYEGRGRVVKASLASPAMGGAGLVWMRVG